MYSYCELQRIRRSFGGGQAASLPRVPRRVLLFAVALCLIGGFLGIGTLPSIQGQTEGIAKYRVRPGDTVWSIVERQRLQGDVRHWVQVVVQMNHLRSSEAIQPGQTLLIPMPHSMVQGLQESQG
ncbi:LysM peptidoglycan-binding domain-containing protein [Alicyclobacillus kakegawensis]|uniref:LysM peptidoglycan-binding domain-containing protein n=1 Tax=Alicyclobacillus kakegawensis TaxID=392012 RepID=UPI00082E8A2D|nr:LysM peptidoglycan-binding domain-containing protein [Alicyclobacillus kakegawensis]